jgi:DNA-binding CsgD family transcriptional regulator
VGAVDIADVELALRCLDCATCASGERVEQADGWPTHTVAQSAQAALLDAAQRASVWVQRRAPDTPPGKPRLPGQFAAPEAPPRGAEPPGPAEGPAQPVLPAQRPLEPPDGADGNGRAWSDQDAHPSPDAAIAKLSSAECRVAALAARGHTNKAISTRLSITVSTVEQHLTRVYRKLNIHERQDLRLVMETDKPWIPLRRRTLEAERKNRGN